MKKLYCLSVALFRDNDFKNVKDVAITAGRFYCYCEAIQNSQVVIIKGEAHAVLCAFNAITGKNATLKEVKEAMRKPMCIFSHYTRG